MSSARDSIVADGEGHSAAVAPTSDAEQDNVAETMQRHFREHKAIRADKANEPGKFTAILLLRVDLDAEQHEPAPEHLLQGPFQSATDAVQRIGLAASDLGNWMDGQRLVVASESGRLPNEG